jgi:GrpB-like predicted nucleotidyltransferase (UPF0157 family)
MSATIVVVDYDSQWADVFTTIRAVLAAALGEVPVVAIEHVGSTSVPGLAAKPIIDVDVVVRRPFVSRAIDALQLVGYEPLGDLGIPDRYAFKAPPDAARQNVYVTVDGCLSLRNHLGLREVLRSDVRLRDEYSAIKKRLARETDDVDVYLRGKSAIIRRILQRAGLTTSALDEIESVNGP